MTYEEDTPFFKRHQEGEYLPDESKEMAMFERTDSILQKAGIHRYEISNFSIPGHESIHNQAYWNGNDYLGLGPSAVSTVRGLRWTNIKDTPRYTESLLAGNRPDREEEIITPEIRTRERLLLGLRTREGVEISSLKDSKELLSSLLSEGYLEQEQNRYRLTPRGRLVADRIALELF